MSDLKNEDGIILGEMGSIYWNISPVVHAKKDDGVLVQLQWGWTADQTEESLEDYADDAPRGFDHVTTTLRDAVSLRDRLTEIIEAYGFIDDEIQRKREEDEKPLPAELLAQLLKDRERRDGRPR